MSRKHGSRRATGSRSPVWAKILVGLGAVLMVASIGTVTYIKVMLEKVNDAVATQCLLADCQQHEPGEDIKGPLNLLLIGSDMRKSWVSAQSDSIMILHINKDLTAANIISVPRDLYVDIPDCGPGWNNGPCTEKINTAFAAGGKDMAKSMQNLAKTLVDRTGLPSFDGAAVINFDGFSELVDLFGGVELCVPFDMTLAHPEGTKVKKGCKEYKSEIALGIVRERYAYDPTTPGWKEEYGMGDYGRQRMQQHFIKQLLKKAKEQGYITDPFKVGTLIEKIGDQILVDLKGRKPVDLAFALKGIDATGITTLKIPSEPAMIGDTSYVVIQEGEQKKAADDLFAALVNDTLDEWAVSHPKWVNKTG